MGIHALVHAGAIVAAEVAFDEAYYLVAGKAVLDLKAQAGELRRGPEFANASLWRVVVWEASEIGGDVALRVGGAKNILKIDESAEFQNRVADSERTERYLFCFALFLKSLSVRLLPGIGAWIRGRRFDRGCHRTGRGFLARTRRWVDCNDARRSVF